MDIDYQKIDEYENMLGIHKDNPHKGTVNMSNMENLAKHAIQVSNEDSYKTKIEKYDKFLNDIIEYNLSIHYKDIDTKCRINRVLQIVYYMKHLAINFHCIQEAINLVYDYKHADDNSIFKFMPRDDSNNTNYQDLILWCLHYMQEYNYKKYNGCVYRQIYSNDYPTGAWEKVDSIQNILYQSINKEINYNQFLNVTSSSRDLIKATSEFLTKFDDKQFPFLNKDRHCFSFKNGIYYTKDNLFVKYEHLEHIPTTSKYFNVDFPEEDPETPYLDSILDYQQLSEEVKNIIFVFMGRLLYEINTLDGWQCIMFLEGQAGTGKSTIVNVCKDFYDEDDVGVLSNNIQKQFGLSDIYDKKMYIAPEIKKDFSIDQCEFQSIISGDKLNIAIKYQPSKTLEWNIPGIMAGNEIPDFIDNSGSIQRRILTVKFNHKVKNGDLKLQEKLRNEMGHIIKKINNAYLYFSKKYGSTNIWSVVPEYFRQTQKELAATTNPLVHLFCSNKVEFGTDKYIPEQYLKQLYNNHCIENNYKRQRWNPQLYLGPIQQFDITISKATKMYAGKNTSDLFFNGIDIVDNTEEE